MKMKLVALVLANILALSICAFSQAKLDQFPLGTTTMRFSVVTEDLSAPQALELQVVVRPNSTYTVRMLAEATGTAPQLSGFGFLFGAAGLAYGGGEDVSLSALQVLVDQRSRLQEGDEYLLPGGGTFTNVVLVDIAGVRCVEGSYVDPKNRDTRMTVALGVSKPVYTVPRVRVERLRGGTWETVFLMELVAYTFVGP